MNALAVALNTDLNVAKNVPEQGVKRNLALPLRALQSARASSAASALSAELRLALRWR